MPGPPPEPTERKRARGNPGQRKLPEPVVQLVASSKPPPAPEHLFEAGRAAWERLWTAGQAWVSPETDLAIMTRLCEAYDMRRAMTAQFEEDGFMVEGSQGQPRVNPLLDKLLALDAQITTYEGKCGFTPADRARLGVAEVKRANAVEEFLAKRSARANRKASP
jgi:P27 family predicted phage terminase small subunit